MRTEVRTYTVRPGTEEVHLGCMVWGEPEHLGQGILNFLEGGLTGR